MMDAKLRLGIKMKKRQTRARANGFTLMELLIVISIMLILMLIAIPNFRSMTMTANELSAKNSLQAIYKAEIQYQTAFPATARPGRPRRPRRRCWRGIWRRRA